MSISSQSSYVVTFTLDSSTGSYEAGDYQATPNGIVLWVCGDDLIFNGLPYGSVTAGDGHCWLDRNLGAIRVAQTSDDSLAYGYLYQWGRASDGHQRTTSTVTTTLSTSDTPDHGQFIISGSTPYDWRDPQNDSLWQEIDEVNDPCPIGWHIPTGGINGEWKILTDAESISNSSTAFDSLLKLPAAGYRGRTNGGLYNQGLLGYYWASSVNGTNASRFIFGHSPDAYHRAYGLSVRCLKD